MKEITIENLRCRYPETSELALDGISLEIEKGEFIGVIGRNGAGKSTLAQAIVGLVPQFYGGGYGGKIFVSGSLADQTPVAEMCEKVGLVFQNPFNQLSGAKETVCEEVGFGIENLGVPKREMERRIEDALRRMDMWEYRDRNPFDLSGGQMQRVAIASILVMQPEVIILDEPTSQLDPQGTEEVFRVVDDLAHTGITIIMIEQKIEKLASYCSRILLLDGGCQIAFDTPGRIFSRDDLAEHGVQAPACTRICQAKGVHLPDGTFPATLPEAARLLAGLPEGEGGISREEALAGRGAQAGETVFDVRDLSFCYTKGTDIFRKLNLSLQRVPTAIIGQNGAGKTTLVKILKGLLHPVSGSVLYGGEDIGKKTVAMLAGKVGYVFQNPDDQIFKYRVIDEVMFGPMNIGMSKEEARSQALRALQLVQLQDLADKNPYDLELYERKMVAIASVLAMNTDVLILDEPTIAQDLRGRQVIGSIIRQLTAEGKLVLAILHDMDFVAKYFDRVVVMAHGRVLADGTPAYVFLQDEALRQARVQKPYVLELARQLGYERVYLSAEEFC